MIIFCAGLMKDPKPLVQFIYEMQIEEYLRQMRTSEYPSIDADLFKSLHAESAVKWSDHPLHNQFVNHHDHKEDVLNKRPLDTTSVFYPSRLYHFRFMEEAVVVDAHHSEIDCAMWISYPAESVRNNILTTCSTISLHQPVRDLHMDWVTCRDSSLTALRMINPQSLHLFDCDLPDQFVRSLIRDLFGAEDSLQQLWLLDIDLSPCESLLDELLENLVAHHETHEGQRELELRLRGTKLSGDFRKRWRERCRGVESIDCYIRDDWVRSSVPSLEPLIQTNSNSLSHSLSISGSDLSASVLLN